ncbi:hypothetical protein ACFVMC_17350 [Nocardia sp. NPDC127579]|uniref:hypothetical protein n=1 Tax=Nocardia sp. NPDC127579 TaxID=3345402 RepID=UPI00362CFAB6
MYRTRIEHPIATGRIHWLPAEHRFGPVTGGLYHPSALPGVGTGIRLGDLLLGIQIERSGQHSDEGELVQIAFHAPTLAAPHLYPGARWTIFEGPRPVAELAIKAVLIKTS